MKKFTAPVIIVISLFLLGSFSFLISDKNRANKRLEFLTEEGGPEIKPHPLSIQALREGDYPGSELVIEQTLTPGNNYQRYIASYKSEGLKIYGLLTVPNGESEWPAIIFNHGYIPPDQYKTTEKYIAYQDAFARNGYVTFKPDYRGHGNSEGEAHGGYGSNEYTIDVLNAVSSVQKLDSVNPDEIGMWGHSMGGHITLESMVVNPSIKAGVIWAGVVGSYEDIFERWRRRNPSSVTPTPGGRGWWRFELAQKYGEPQENPDFWKSLSATSYLSDISGPVQLHHGTADASVDVELSKSLESKLKDVGKPVELNVYEGDDHNLSGNLSLALSRSVTFFDDYLK
jgi:dipeptidyl aminopeptidase/acylaminoacyl peptidase